MRVSGLLPPISFQIFKLLIQKKHIDTAFDITIFLLKIIYLYSVVLCVL